MGYADHTVSGGLAKLVTGWEALVTSVVKGEPQDYYEYLNDMDGRRILAEALEVASPEERAKFAARVDMADERLRPHLQPSVRCIWGEDVAAKRGWTPEKAWWYFHRPRLVDDSWEPSL